MLRRIAFGLTGTGLAGVSLGLGLGLLAGRPARGAALSLAVLGFVALCFGNAARAVSRSVRPRDGRAG